MIKLPNNVVSFAASKDTKVKIYEQFADYFIHHMKENHNVSYGIFESGKSLKEKDEQVHKALLAEVEKIAGVKFDNGIVPKTVFATNPAVQWATMAIVGAMIDTILPITIIDSIGLYTDMRNVGYGDTLDFTIAPRQLMTVSEGGNAQRHSFVQKQFKTTKSLRAVNHAITVQVELYRVLAGLESLAEFTRKAIISIQTQMTVDAYDAFRAGLSAVTVPSELRVTGYDEDELLRLCETVTAYNQGAKAVIAGTARALRHVLPNEATGHRIVTDISNISIQLIRNFINYDILVLPQVATGNYNDYGLALNDEELYVISPSSEKLVKGVLEGQTLSNTDGVYQNANLTQSVTFNMRYDFMFLSNATAASMTI